MIELKQMSIYSKPALFYGWIFYTVLLFSFHIICHIFGSM